MATENAIYNKAAECLKAFNGCIESMASTSWPQDQLDRFNLWAAHGGIFGSYQKRTSMDWRLRERPELVDMILQLLDLLHEYLSVICTLSNPESDPKFDTGRTIVAIQEADRQKEPPLSSASASTSSSECSFGLAPGKPSVIADPIDATRGKVEQTLAELFRISAAIRSAGMSYRHTRAANFVEWQDGVNLTQKFKEGVELFLQRKKPSPSDYMVRRLVETICLRQRELAYSRRKRIGKSGKETTKDSIKSHGVASLPPRSTAGYSRQGGSGSTTSKVTHTPIGASRGKVAQPGAHQSTIYSATHVPTTVSFQTKPLESLKTRPKWCTIDDSLTNLPLPPIVDGKLELECPYCFILFEKAKFQGSSWRTHVLEDCRPYICILPDCTTPHVLYKDSISWISHMQTNHKVVKWKCIPSCQSEIRSFQTEAEFLAHAESEHKEGSTAEEILELANLGRYEIDRELEVDILLECPICTVSFETEDFLSVYSHIANDLSEYARISLPESPYVDVNTRQETSSRPASIKDGRIGQRRESEIEADRMFPWSLWDSGNPEIGSDLAYYDADLKPIPDLSDTHIMDFAKVLSDIRNKRHKYLQQEPDPSQNLLREYKDEHNLNEEEVMAISFEDQAASSLSDYQPQSLVEDLENVTTHKEVTDTIDSRNQPQVRREPTSQPKREATPQPKKEPTYRVRGVPNDWDKEKLESFLVERDGPAGPVIQSLVREFHGRSQTATVFFKNTCQLPLRISLPEPSGQFGELRNLTLDHGFLGITTLFAPPQQDHKVDIIAICGLGGHAFGSFKERGGEHMWLRDALPYDITAESGQRIARIMVYGHVPSFLDSDSFQILEDTGIALHSDLRNLVSDGSFKPIVFIAHSLGGLVVKQFLISLSYSKDEVDQKLTRAVYGLSFFGVPHDGMVIHSLIPMAGDGPNRFLPESNRSINSKILSIQHREFLKALGGQGQSEIILFYETCLSPTALKDENGRWKMSGEPDVLGTKASATHCRHWENGPEHICAINRTHSEMVKFAEGDPEYDKVLERIKPLAQRAITARRGRLQRNLSKDEQNCLQSLAFEQMQDRGNDIDHAIQGTCEWLLKHDTYMNWPTSLEGLLCIKGKPGAGKSTLLKYAISKQRDIPSAKDDDVVLSFFFHGRGNALQKSPLGFLRSVLYQALEKAPEAFPALVDAYQQKCNVMGDPPQWQWNPEELWRFFESSLPKILANRSIWLFVDALDECGEGHARNLVQRFKALLKGIPQLPSGIHFRVCFSCRHYPILSSRDMLEVCLETENEDDITTYVRSTLELESFEEPMRLKIRDLIISRASGVFLWAQLVVKKVQDLELDGDGPNMIEATIHSMPKSLRELYKELIRDMTPSSLRLIQWVCFAARPLSTEELRWAMAIDVGRPSLQECQKAYDYIPDSKRMGQQVIKLSRGLAEVFTGSNTQVVQFIHPSVKDFFMDEGLVTLDNTSTSTDEAIGQAQFQLLRTCTLYLKMEEISQSTSRGPGLEAEFPFLHYAVTLWVSHLQKCDATNFSSRNILELLSWPSNAIFDLWTHLYKKFGYSVDSTPVAKTTLIHIAAEYCLAGLLTAILENNCQTCENFDLKDDDGRTPLSLAAESGNEAIIKTLLDTGQVNVNSKDRTGLTPLSWAAEYGQEAVVKLLLNAGAEINSKSLTNRTPLSWAAEYEQEAVLKLLLNAGAEVDLKDQDGQTPLLRAAEGGQEAIVKLLLNAGAEVDSKDQDGWTPLSKAAEYGQETVVKLLLNAGAEVDLKDQDGRTPLWWAVRSWSGEATATLLLDMGADVNSKDRYGQTPLWLAVTRRSERMVELLLERGAEVDLNDDNGEELLWWAAKYGDEGIVRLLKARRVSSPFQPISE